MAETNLIHEKIRDIKELHDKDKEFIRSSEGEIRKLLINLEIIIEKLNTIEKVEFNEFTKNIIIDDEILANKHLPKIRSDISRIFFMNFTIEDILQALQNLSQERKFHPVKNMIQSKKWDGKKRVESFFIDYFGADDSKYIRTLANRWFTGAVARIYKPGIKFEVVPILQGKQGVGKSTMGMKLAGEYFTDSLRGMGKNKDDYQLLIGKWIIELAELSSMNQTKVEEVKQFMSAQTDTIRLPYGKVMENHDRTVVFYGTTNDDTYLKDPTGNRRFFPVKVNEKREKDIHKITREEVQQIWAEAYELFKKGERIYYETEEHEYIDKHYRNDAIIEDTLLTRVEEYINLKVPKEWNTLKAYEKRAILNNGYLIRNETRIEGDRAIEKVAAREMLEVFEFDINRPNIDSLVRKINTYLNHHKEWENKDVYIGGKSFRGFQRK